MLPQQNNWKIFPNITVRRRGFATENWFTMLHAVVWNSEMKCLANRLHLNVVGTYQVGRDTISPEQNKI